VFNLFKQKVTAEKYGHQMWLFCCDSAENFYVTFKPKLQTEGFVHNPTADRMFINETIILHYWIIWWVLNKDTAVLDVLNNYFWSAPVGLDIQQTQAQAPETLTKRFARYDEAFSKDLDMSARGGLTTRLPKTVLQCLVNENPDADLLFGFEMFLAVQSTIFETMKTVRKLRGDVNIRVA
jgi:hypothetical protein